MMSGLLRTAVLAVLCAASVNAAAKLDINIKTIPMVRIASTAAEADPLNNVIAPIPGTREGVMQYIAGGEDSLPESFDAERGISKFSSGYYQRLARTLTHLKAMVAAYRLNADAVLIVDDAEEIVQHPSFKWKGALDDFVARLPNGWQHCQLSVLALPDSLQSLLLDWDSKGRESTVLVDEARRSRPNSELWSYGAYLVSKTGLANTLLTYSNREKTEGPRRLKFDLSRATCIEADNCLLWEGVHGQGWLVATPPLLAAARQVSYDADATEVEVSVSELIKENMYHFVRWYEEADDFVRDAKDNTLQLPTTQQTNDVMYAVGVEPSTPEDPPAVAARPKKSKRAKKPAAAAAAPQDDGAPLEGSDADIVDQITDDAPEDAAQDVDTTDAVADDANEGDSVDLSMEGPADQAKPVEDEPASQDNGLPPGTNEATDEDGNVIRTQNAFTHGERLWEEAWGEPSQSDAEEADIQDAPGAAALSTSDAADLVADADVDDKAADVGEEEDRGEAPVSSRRGYAAPEADADAGEEADSSHGRMGPAHARIPKAPVTLRHHTPGAPDDPIAKQEEERRLEEERDAQHPADESKEDPRDVVDPTKEVEKPRETGSAAAPIGGEVESDEAEVASLLEQYKAEPHLASALGRAPTVARHYKGARLGAAATTKGAYVPYFLLAAAGIVAAALGVFAVINWPQVNKATTAGERAPLVSQHV